MTFHSVGNGIIIPTDFHSLHHFFRGVGQAPTRLLLTIINHIITIVTINPVIVFIPLIHINHIEPYIYIIHHWNERKNQTPMVQSGSKPNFRQIHISWSISSGCCGGRDLPTYPALLEGLRHGRSDLGRSKHKPVPSLLVSKKHTH